MNSLQLRNLERQVREKMKEVLERDFDDLMLSLDLDSMVDKALELCNQDLESKMQDALQEHINEIVSENIESSIDEIVDEKVS